MTESGSYYGANHAELTPPIVILNLFQDLSDFDKKIQLLQLEWI